MQSEPAEDKRNAENPEPALRQVISIVFYVRIDGHTHAGHDSCNQPYPNRQRPHMIDVLYEGAANERRANLAKGAHDGSPKQAARNA